MFLIYIYLIYKTKCHGRNTVHVFCWIRFTLKSRQTGGFFKEWVCPSGELRQRLQPGLAIEGLQFQFEYHFGQ